MIAKGKEYLKRSYLIFRKRLLTGLAPLFEAIFKDRRSLPKPSDVQKILYIRNDRLGDMVLSLPALESVRNAFASASITVLASWSNHSLLNGPTPADHYLVLDPKMRWKDQAAVVRRLRRSGFDLTIDPFSGPELRPAVTAFLSRSKFQVGHSGFGREVFYHHPANPPIHDHHFIDNNLDMLREIGVSAVTRKPKLVLTREEKNRGLFGLRRMGWAGEPLVGIHPGAYHWTQRWPEEYFIKVIEQLTRDEKCWVLLFGAGADQKILDQIHRGLHLKPGVWLANDLREFASAVSFCRTFVCNNSGPLHLAAALDIPTISTMGPTDKNRWWPRGKGHIVLRRDELPCIGCNRGYCRIGTHACMRDISPSAMLHEIRAKL